MCFPDLGTFRPGLQRIPPQQGPFQFSLSSVPMPRLSSLLCSLRAAVGLDDVFDLSPADGTAGVGHLLELQSAGVAETHVAAGVDDRVHRVLVADGALCVAPPQRRR